MFKKEETEQIKPAITWVPIKLPDGMWGVVPTCIDHLNIPGA